MVRTAVGFLAYVRPTFLVPAVGMSVYGAGLSQGSDPVSGALHASLVGTILLVAHLRDGRVDGHERGEEEPRLTEAQFRRGVRVGSVAAAGLSGLLFVRAGTLAALPTAALLPLALLHAPYLDRHPATATVDYPVGIGIALLGGYATQSGGVSGGVVGAAAAFVGLLSGIKVGIDRLDAAFDASIRKRTVPVAYGSAGAERVAVVLFAATAVGTAALAALGVARPRFVLAAATVPVGCLVATVAAPVGRAVRVQMLLTYAFAGLLFVGLCGGCVGRGILAAVPGVGGV